MGKRQSEIFRKVKYPKDNDLPSNQRKKFLNKNPDRFHGCLLGLATGDAVGTTLEFRPKGSFPPITDLMGGGPFGLIAGQWTDDTSMALCLTASLIEKQGFDPADQMDRYWKWYKHGYMSSTGRCFDIGNTVRYALERFHATRKPFSGSTSPGSAGNGSLMRLAPIPLYYFPKLEKIIHFAGESSRTTHGAPECIEACLSTVCRDDLFGVVRQR